MADLKSVAGLFGMTVSELEQFTGYSRQEFHRVMDNGKAVGTARMMDTIRSIPGRGREEGQGEVVEIAGKYLRSVLPDGAMPVHKAARSPRLGRQQVPWVFRDDRRGTGRTMQGM